MFVFDQEFHVSSGALKLHSAFFRKSLESSDGVQPSSDSPFFTSDWYTEVDEYNNPKWRLTADKKVS